MKPAEQIIDALKKALADLGIEGAEPVLERPADMAHGDYSTNVALAYAKQLGKNPRQVAESVVASLGMYELPVVKIDIAGPGFINFRLNEGYFIENLKSIDEEYGKGNDLSGKTVLVEYTQPNILKPFHIGHLMSNTLGESLARLIENAGAKVEHLNYQGDVGLHIPKALWGIRALDVDINDIHAIGKAYAHGAQAYENDEQAKAEIDALNKKVYEKDPEVMELYEAGKKTSLKLFEELYALLGTRFDRYYFESEVFARGVELVNEGKEKGIFKESEGAVVFPGEDYGLHTRVFITSKGLPVYEAKELALAELKAKEYPDFDISITTTAVEQEQYFQVVFKALGLLKPELDGRFTHIAHGMMQISGGKMSSRLGNVITGESLISSLIAEVQERMGERVAPELTADVAKDVGVAAIKYTVLRQALRKNIIFDEERSLSFEGDSGPYIQYTAVRSRSVVAKAKDAGITPSFDVHPESVGLVERMLERFPEVAQRAAQEREPHHVATYLIELSSAFNSWYAQEQIIDVDDALSPYRVALADAVSNVLARGLWLLGIRVPVAM
ncbi:MAG: arginyl-tRNA synthetase [Patescibacteria group bacterium]|jgi:arginyl-tRNA synthetase|nr:arginyl-tRNA synthetase [Patescibacteria group bacterium]